MSTQSHSYKSLISTRRTILEAPMSMSHLVNITACAIDQLLPAGGAGDAGSAGDAEAGCGPRGAGGAGLDASLHRPSLALTFSFFTILLFI